MLKMFFLALVKSFFTKPRRKMRRRKSKKILPLIMAHSQITRLLSLKRIRLEDPLRKVRKDAADLKIEDDLNLKK